MSRANKSSDYFEALGTVDELAAHLGLAREFCSQAALGKQLEEQLSTVQSRLLDIGSHIATPLQSSKPEQIERVKLEEGGAAVLEKWIDAMDEDLPALRNFILPGGGPAACQLHVARAVCRRAERAVVPLVNRGDAAQTALVYLNRLSDYLFVAARWAAFKAGKPDVVYRKGVGVLDSKASTQYSLKGGQSRRSAQTGLPTVGVALLSFAAGALVMACVICWLLYEVILRPHRL